MFDNGSTKLTPIRRHDLDTKLLFLLLRAELQPCGADAIQNTFLVHISLVMFVKSMRCLCIVRIDSFFNEACALIISFVFYLSQGLTKILRWISVPETRALSIEHYLYSVKSAGLSMKYTIIIMPEQTHGVSLNNFITYNIEAVKISSRCL